MLAGVLIVCFAISLPFWLESPPEKQRSVADKTTAKQLLEQQPEALDMPQEEREQLKKMLIKPAPENHQRDFARMVWIKDMKQVILKWVPDDNEAEEVAHWAYIYSTRFELSPELVLGVIAVESQFDHFAVSNVGARGLMQVMPFWKDSLGSSEDNLFDIETNIRYGCAILRHYIDRYKKVSSALAAYNGSLGKAKYPNKVFQQMRQFKATKEDSRTPI